MPVREKAVSTAFSTLMGDTSYHFYKRPGAETATIDGVTMPYDEFQKRFIEPIERIYERVVDSIDWNRVMLEAWARHTALGHDKDEDEWNYPHTAHICPSCLCEALMADSTHVDWTREPDAPRYHNERP